MKFIDNIIFALTYKASSKRIMKLRKQVILANEERAKGVASYLSRNNILIYLERLK